MKDNSNRNVLAIVVVISNQDTPLVEEYTPLPSVIGFDEPTVEDLPALTEAVTAPEPESLASKDTGIDLGEETILPEIAGYDIPTVDDLPPVTLDGSGLPDIEPVELLSVDELPPLES